MPEKTKLTERFFNSVILERPVIIILIILAVVSFLTYKARDFKLDASAETLVLENDADLQFSRVVYKRYGMQEFMILTCSPFSDMFSEQSFDLIKTIKKALLEIKSVTSVTTMLDVPLLESPPVQIQDLKNNVRTLQSSGVDKKLARVELVNSPIYKNLLISPDGNTTALIINIENDDLYRELLERRNDLRDKIREGDYTEEEKKDYLIASEMFQNHRERMRKEQHDEILKIRAIMNDHKKEADLFLGGVSMIADDLITFIKNDLKVFGAGVLFFLVVTLAIIFKRPRWVILPLLCCSFSVVSMMGLLGLFGWEVTVISSNFISLQLIITMSLTIHLIVRYRELHAGFPDWDQRTLVLKTVSQMIKPCVYASLTTMAGFGSLLFCNILPVITFGWMMSAGIVVSMIMTFFLFPALLMLMKKGAPPQLKENTFALTSITARFTEHHGKLIMVTGIFLLVASAIGISRLVVENSFIDYFKKTTEIYQGMKIIDQKLGGTTPLDVLIDLTSDNALKPDSMHSSPEKKSNNDSDDAFDAFDEFDTIKTGEKYWFTAEKMDIIMKVHDYIESLPETGKVLSLATLLKVAEKFNEGKPFDNFQLALLYSEIPDEYKTMLLSPYVSVENNQVRFAIRIKDSLKDLKRDLLLKKMRHDIVNQLGIDNDKVHLSGMLVLYNNMLQSLFNSQILTLGIVIIALLTMFLILFRSVKIAFVAIFPSFLSIGCVLGFMGWMGIPLDMMTITIASISVGIAVDDTIHYIHRFRQEFEKDHDYIKTLHRCHTSIGHAMLYTSITIIIGFSILALSNFIPSIYFGLLTGLAMFIALIAALTLLPQLIVFFKPMSKAET
ncbi:MAG: MMPL family transporter [Proteobacteria bacterium]|nr:MMPL family transporter [Pseudomonadota bacterium]